MSRYSKNRPTIVFVGSGVVVGFVTVVADGVAGVAGVVRRLLDVAAVAVVVVALFDRADVFVGERKRVSVQGANGAVG